MLMRLAEEFGFQVHTFQHVLEGYKVADEIATHGDGGFERSATGGPTSSRSYDAIPYNAHAHDASAACRRPRSTATRPELARRLNIEAAKA